MTRTLQFSTETYIDDSVDDSHVPNIDGKLQSIGSPMSNIFSIASTMDDQIRFQMTIISSI